MVPLFKCIYAKTLDLQISYMAEMYLQIVKSSVSTEMESQNIEYLHCLL